MEQAELMCQDEDEEMVSRLYKEAIKQSKQVIQGNVVDYEEHKEEEEEQSLPKMAKDGENPDNKGE